MNERCMPCRGKGFNFQSGGYTESDRKTCGRCHGVGVVPEGSQKKAKRPSRDYNKHQGIDELKMVEAW